MATTTACARMPLCEAILSLEEAPKYTCCCLLADKEEIGSVGATGMQARYFENAMAELMDADRATVQRADTCAARWPPAGCSPAT